MVHDGPATTHVSLRKVAVPMGVETSLTRSYWFWHAVVLSGGPVNVNGIVASKPKWASAPAAMVPEVVQVTVCPEFVPMDAPGLVWVMLPGTKVSRLS